MKKGLFIRGTTEADVAQRGQVAELHESTWMHTWHAKSDTMCVCLGPRV